MFVPICPHERVVESVSLTLDLAICLLSITVSEQQVSFNMLFNQEQSSGVDPFWFE